MSDSPGVPGQNTPDKDLLAYRAEVGDDVRVFEKNIERTLVSVGKRTVLTIMADRSRADNRKGVTEHEFCKKHGILAQQAFVRIIKPAALPRRGCFDHCIADVKEE